MNRITGIRLAAWILAAASAPGSAATFCANSVQALGDALTTAAANGADDTIKIVHGSYATGGTPFSYNSSEAHSVDIIGGYNSDCSARVRNPH